jgi:hypothetical protein
VPPSTVAVKVPETVRFTAVVVPVNAPLLASGLELIAELMLSNSVLISVPLIIFPALPVDRLSLTAKFVAFV